MTAMDMDSGLDHIIDWTAWATDAGAVLVVPKPAGQSAGDPSKIVDPRRWSIMRCSYVWEAGVPSSDSLWILDGAPEYRLGLKTQTLAVVRLLDAVGNNVGVAVSKQADGSYKTVVDSPLFPAAFDGVGLDSFPGGLPVGWRWTVRLYGHGLANSLVSPAWRTTAPVASFGSTALLKGYVEAALSYSLLSQWQHVREAVIEGDDGSSVVDDCSSPAGIIKLRRTIASKEASNGRSRRQVLHGETDVSREW